MKLPPTEARGRPLSNPEQLLGPKTLERMRKTRWYAYARIIEKVRYYRTLEIEKASLGPGMCLDHVHVFGVTEEGGCNFDQVLVELMHECERLAVLEVAS